MIFFDLNRDTYKYSDCRDDCTEFTQTVNDSFKKPFFGRIEFPSRNVTLNKKLCLINNE